MRVAVVSDIHGNVVALDAVLRAARQEGIQTVWCIGDLVAHGPRPAEVVALLRAASELVCVRGNTDRYVTTGDVRGIDPPIDRPRDREGERLLVAAIRSFAWTRDRLNADAAQWLGALPLEHRTTLPDGSRVLLVHASPGRDDGPGLRLDDSDDALTFAGIDPARLT